jgi:glycosyltransferase involved in cell wall biosynthesis
MEKISIIIPTYNCKSEKKNCIEIALRALLNQTLKTFEVVIVDNATNDNTLTDLLPLFDSFSEQSIGLNVVRCEMRGNKCLA